MNECLHQQAPVVYSPSLLAQAAQPAICDSTACPWVNIFFFRRLAIRTTTLSLCVELFLNYNIVHWCYCDGLAWCLMKATKEQGQALLLVDVGLTTITQQQWQNDDCKQNEHLCVLENAKGMALTPNTQGGFVMMLPCHAVISYDDDSSLSLKLQNQREILR